jgi:hypothetical protein
MTASEWQEPPAAASRVPGVVLAAAIVTWVAATVTAALVGFLSLALMTLAGSVFATFPGSGDPRWSMAVSTGIVIALSAAADVAAFFTVRRRRVAAWALLGLSALAAVGGLAFGYLIAPLAVSGAGIAVIVLLLQPAARRWVRPAPDVSLG